MSVIGTYLKTEDICYALLDAFASQLPAALLEVQTVRTREPLVLPMPVEIGLGNDDTMLDEPASAFPRVFVVGAPSSPDATAQGTRTSQTLHTVLVSWTVVASTRLGATLLGWRYAEALRNVVQTQSPFAGFSPRHFDPQIDEGAATNLSLNRYDVTDRVWMAGGLMRVEMTGRYIV